MTNTTTLRPTSDEELKFLLSTPMSEPIPDEIWRPYLSSPPWHTIEGAFNLREVSYPPLIRPNLIYRSGMLAFLSESRKEDLVKVLGIKAIFDLRFDEERLQSPDPVIEGVESVVVGVSAEGKGWKERGWRSMVDMMFLHLEVYRDAFRELLLFVRDNPGQPLLIHCTAGKDRTRVAVALLLGISHVPKDFIAHDFALTRIGIEPVRKLLQAKLTGGRKVDLEDERLKAIAGCEASDMLKFLGELNARFQGGVEGFVKEQLGLTGEDLGEVRKNLRGLE